EGLPAASKATTLAVRVPLDSDDTSKVCETTWLPLGATPATDSAVVAPSASSIEIVAFVVSVDTVAETVTDGVPAALTGLGVTVTAVGVVGTTTSLVTTVLPASD